MRIKRSQPSLLKINTYLGWHKYYVARFNSNPTDDTAHLAMYYLMLHLMESDSNG